MNSAKQQSTDDTAGAEDEPNPLDDGILDSASFQEQINAMNATEASHSSVAPFDEVEVTGVRQNPYPQTLTYAMAAVCPGLEGVQPKGSYGAIMQYCAAQLDNGVSLRTTPPQFGDQLSPGELPRPEMNSNGLLGLHQHTSAYEGAGQSPQGRLRGGLLRPPTASPANHSGFSNQSRSPNRGLLPPPPVERAQPQRIGVFNQQPAVQVKAATTQIQSLERTFKPILVGHSMDDTALEAAELTVPAV